MIKDETGGVFVMKKGIAVLLALLLCMLACCALADDLGEAVIDGRNGYKVHLREEPSTDSASLGLFFTGTTVSLRAEPDDGWVKVKIGRERGYIKEEYLKTGAAAERVTPRFWSGTVSATKYARMRKDPSTEYQFIRNVNDGENLTIMGETDEGWYYVLYKGDKGFISKNLIYTRGSAGGVVNDAKDDYVYTPVVTPAPVKTWKTAYREYVLANYQELMTYALIYVDADSVPELVIHTGAEAGGCQILTWHNGIMDVLQTRRLNFTYRQQENLLCNSDGHMGYYYDAVYEIRNGQWMMLAYGSYDNPEGWDEVQQRYVCNNYTFNGNALSEADYLRALDRVYPRSGARQANNRVDLPGIITLLRE